MGGRESKVKLDLRGLVCPFTLIVLQREVKRLEGTASLVEVLVTDPSACESVPAWAESRGHKVVEVAEEGEHYRITIRLKVS